MTTPAQFVVGDRIRYVPSMIQTDVEAEGVVVMVEPAGATFRMDMIAIDEVEHWIPARDCERIRFGLGES